MSVTLQALEALGCYNNAGYLDHYDGKTHRRLAEVTPKGDLVWLRNGEAEAIGLNTKAIFAAFDKTDNDHTGSLRSSNGMPVEPEQPE